MAQITTVALANRDVKNYVGGITPVFLAFDATNLSAVVTNGDRIKIAEIPANSRIIGASVRVVGTSAVTGIINLQSMEPTGNAILLTGNLANSIAATVMMSLPHSPITSVTAARTVELVVTSGSIGNSVAGNKWYVGFEYATYP